MNKIILIGYSGHSYVVADTIESSGGAILGYCDDKENEENPNTFKYFGSEKDLKVLPLLRQHYNFISIGNNSIREKIFRYLEANGISKYAKAIHPSSFISKSVKLDNLVLVAPNATINAFAEIGIGVICNTSSIIEHECKIGDFAHIAPGATLAGNVTIGERSFIGANSVVKEGVTIGKDVIVGAGSVVVKDIPNGQTVVGNPARPIKNKNI